MFKPKFNICLFLMALCGMPGFSVSFLHINNKHINCIFTVMFFIRITSNLPHTTPPPHPHPTYTHKRKKKKKQPTI